MTMLSASIYGAPEVSTACPADDCPRHADRVQYEPGADHYLMSHGPLTTGAGQLADSDPTHQWVTPFNTPGDPA